MVLSDVISLSTRGFCDIQDMTPSVSAIVSNSKI
ncbi:MAG: hypothetical protein H6Q44_2287, partial [Deltaproteobacteria bacterium]|nr:hypothetical protein [Deltaproteobacteria bacterium]